MNNTAISHKLCSQVMNNCEHAMIMNREGVGIGCADYTGPALLGWDRTYRILENDIKVACSWCEDSHHAAFKLLSKLSERSETFVDGMCIRHGMQFFADIMPENPVRYATVFKLKMIAHVGNGSAVEGKWDTFPTFHALFKASRELSRGNAYREVAHGSHAHYERTGHHRTVWVPGKAQDASQVRITVHVLVK